MVINGFSNYTISDTGDVINIKTNTPKSAWVGANGYLTVDLYSKGKSHKHYIHRLLAEHFIPNPLNKRTVNHIDGNKLNNSLDNLEWATYAENMKHAYDTNLNTCTTKLISDAVLYEILHKFLDGASLTAIAEMYEFSLPTISTYIAEFAKSVGSFDEFVTEKKRQKHLRAQATGAKQRKTINLLMIDPNTQQVLHTFSNVSEAKEYLNRKSCGPIANVIAGRQKSAYGYHWKVV